ncbi:MAG: L,D-transpeptidase [Kofleriaceae bacterium]
MTCYLNGMVVARPWVLAAMFVLGCGGRSADEAPRERTSSPQAPASAEPTGDPEPPGKPEPRPFPDGTHSLELIRTVGVRIEPGEDAKRIGTVAVDTRVGFGKTARAKGCQKPWVEIAPRGWICSDYVKPSTKLPFGREVPMLDRGELVPGVYGKITAPNSVTYIAERSSKDTKKKDGKKADPKGDKKKPDKSGPVTSTKDAEPPRRELKLVEGRPIVGSVNVRQYDEITVGGKAYWRVAQKEGEYVLSQAIRQHRPSVYGGARLGDDTGLATPIAFVWPRVRGWQQVTTSRQPLGGGGARKVAARAPVSILETHADKSGRPLAYRIGDGEWIAAADVRVFNPAPPPKLLRPGERWIDIDLDNQIMVAFEGTLAVYATMVSTGSTATPTETGEYRMWLKESEADMKGLNGEDPYSVATVPWTQFFSPENGLAIHTAYWHDQFGTRRSHGCVNLAPRDARWLYFWSDPQVPPGWTMAAGVVEAPGSIVRVRTKDEPDPPARGYAKKVVEARQQNAAVP